MSITYQVYFGSPHKIEAFTSELQEELKLELAIEAQQRSYAIIGIPYLEAYYHYVQAPQDLFIEEDYGFKPTHCLSIRLNKTNLEGAQNHLVALFCACIKRIDGLMLALREHEIVVFQLKDECFELNISAPLWHHRSRRVDFRAFLKMGLTPPVVEISHKL
jgi:hypothetical protein